MFPERIRRVEELLARELAIMLDREVKDPRIGMVTVSRVHVTKDLRKADVYVSRIGDVAEEDKNCLKALASAAGYMRHLLRERVVLKFLPELVFHLDDGVRHAIRLEEALREIHKTQSGQPPFTDDAKGETDP